MGRGQRGRPPRDYYNMDHAGIRIKRELGPYGSAFGMKREFDDMMLPFRTKRVEKTNNNGEKKQARLEIRKRMINERVKQRQRYISAKKIEAIKELIDKGELPATSLRWKTRRALELAEQGKLGIKDEDGFAMQVKFEDGIGLLNDQPIGPYMNKGGDCRATPCRWSSHEKKKFIELLKSMGKQFTKIAELIKTKNEQQCRTKALILYNKLKLNNWDPKLMEILAPTRIMGAGRKKKRYVRKVKKEEPNDSAKEPAVKRMKTEDGDRQSSVEPEEDVEDTEELAEDRISFA